MLTLLVLTALSHAAPTTTPNTPKVKTETATFAAGCYWGTEKYFDSVPGVISSRVGFTGGQTPNPKYEDTHNGHTGHAESVEIQFDPKKVTYTQLLERFFKIHDPTTKNRQINDVGTQYRSAIFTHGKAQQEAAREVMKRIEKSGAWHAPLTTEVSEAQTFWPGPAEHQKYLEIHRDGYDNHFVRDLKF